MSKKIKSYTSEIEKTVMAKVKSNEIYMKPRWYFVIGSIFMIGGLASSTIAAIFLTNLTLFLLRQHGPNGQLRLQQILSSFPLWIPILAIGGVVTGIWLLKKYDFSYKQNFWLITIGFVVAILLSAYSIDRLGLNDILLRQGPMRRLYQEAGNQNMHIPRGSGRGRNFVR